MRGLATLGHREARTINDTDIPWISHSKIGQTYVDEVTAFTLSAVWACETLIADSIATLPVDTYRKRGTVREETTPPVWLEQPNADYGRVDYDTMRVLSLLGWGDAFSLVYRQNGTYDSADPIVARWVLDPWKVQVRREQGALAYTHDGQPLPAANVQHIRGYSLPGSVRGMSVVENARQSMGLASAAESFGADFYQRGISASGVLEVPAMPADVSKDVVERIRDQFQERYAGTGNSHKPVVVTGGTKWNQISINPDDAQFLETRKFQVNEIARWFRVPPHMIGDVERSTSWGTGIEQQTLGFAKFTLQPWIRRIEEADSRLLPRGQYVRLNLNAFVRADLRTRFAAYQMGRNMGVYSADEVRAFEELPPIPNGAGDIYLQPLNMGEAGAEPSDPGTTESNDDGSL